jgi:hypothetical protein
MMFFWYVFRFYARKPAWTALIFEVKKGFLQAIACSCIPACIECHPDF